MNEKRKTLFDYTIRPIFKLSYIMFVFFTKHYFAWRSKCLTKLITKNVRPKVKGPVRVEHKGPFTCIFYIRDNIRYEVASETWCGRDPWYYYNEEDLLGLPITHKRTAKRMKKLYKTMLNLYIFNDYKDGISLEVNIK